MGGERINKDFEGLLVLSFYHNFQQSFEVVVVPRMSVRPDLGQAFVVLSFNCQNGAENAVLIANITDILSAKNFYWLRKAVLRGREAISNNFILFVSHSK